ncbi:MAG: GGDEF domain-containing protein [Lachnospiraceae bacterium]|nr:GGDEF domain-containing protein [Lachnospiraceae bacterium]
MKKIAVFLDNASNHAIFSRISGLFWTVYEESLDYSISLFRSRGAWKFDEMYNLGEYNIFRLPDLSAYDGFVIIFNDLSEERREFAGYKACHEVIDRIRATGKPAISIGTRIEGMHHVGIDNYASMTAMVRHLTEIHRAHDFWFLMGPEEHVESKQRARAIMDYLAERDDTDHSDRFYYEGFDPSCGERGFRAMLDRFGTLPDAIVCANDHIAIGACTEAAKHGFTAPADFLITGFDNIDMAACHTPALTTIDQHWPELGRVCIEYFKAVFAGEDFPESTPVYTQMIRRQSCGCEMRTPDEAAELFNASIRRDMEMESFSRQLIRLEGDLRLCGTVREIGEAYAQMIPFLRCASIHLVLDRRFYSEREQTELLKKGSRHRDTGEGLFLTEGYPPQMVLAFTCRAGGVTDADVPVSRMYDSYGFLPAPKDALFLPVHFAEYTVGYLVIVHAEYLIRNAFSVRAIQMLLSAIENCYVHTRLQSANDLLSRASITDAMTGFYNRMGYQEVALSRFQEYCEQGQDVTILFADMDGLKKLNDQCGHEAGDYAIVAVAQAIRRICPKKATVARMGGDEFLIMLPETDEARVEELIAQIEAEIPRTEAAKKLPYPPGISIGHVRTDASSRKTLDQYVHLSDELMYEVKRRHKARQKQGGTA